MKNALIAFALIALGIKFGSDYLFSEKFQQYADRTKAPWTCKVTLLLGQLSNVMSHYGEARGYFERVLNRCPETNLAEDAMFEMARAVENAGQRAEAADLYQQFANKYPATNRGKLAEKTADLLK